MYVWPVWWCGALPTQWPARLCVLCGVDILCMSRHAHLLVAGVDSSTRRAAGSGNPRRAARRLARSARRARSHRRVKLVTTSGKNVGPSLLQGPPGRRAEMWPERRSSEPCSKSCGKFGFPVESGVDLVRDLGFPSCRVAKVSWRFNTRRTRWGGRPGPCGPLASRAPTKHIIRHMPGTCHTIHYPCILKHMGF